MRSFFLTIAMAWRKLKRIVHRPDENKNTNNLKMCSTNTVADCLHTIALFPIPKANWTCSTKKKDCSHCLPSWDSQLYAYFLVVYGVHICYIRSVFLIYKDVHFLKLNHSKIYWSLLQFHSSAIVNLSNFKVYFILCVQQKLLICPSCSQRYENVIPVIKSRLFNLASSASPESCLTKFR